MQLYSYDGPVMSFEKIVDEHWSGKTQAVSARKAKSNLMYRYKKEHGYESDAKISLPNEVEEVRR